VARSGNSFYHSGRLYWPKISMVSLQSPSDRTVKVIAAGLSLNTLQGIAIVQDRLIVPTMTGEILQVTMAGETSVLVDLLKADLGIGFAIAPNDANSVVVTTSTYDPLHFLLRVGLDGSVQVLADLSEFNTPYGAPFGVVRDGRDYLLAGSQDVINDRGLLYQVQANGRIQELVSLVEFGDPLELWHDRDTSIISLRNGYLLQVKNKVISVLANLKEFGFGVAFGIRPWNGNYIMTTNTRQIIQVTPTGKVSTLYDLTDDRVGVPAGLEVWRDRWIVSTDGGWILQISS
jgi:hypothetical protein